jgi:hypothetical protein
MVEMNTMALKMIYYRVGVFNSAVNPLLYALWYRYFREGVIKLLTKNLLQFKILWEYHFRRKRNSHF